MANRCCCGSIRNPLPSKLLRFLRATGRGEAEKQHGVPVFRDLGDDKPYMMSTSCPLTWLGSKGVPVSSNPNVPFPHPAPSAQLPPQGCHEWGAHSRAWKVVQSLNS